MPTPEVRRWSPWWPGHVVAWHDQQQHASQLVERHLYGEVPQVGTWDMATSEWWAARHGPGAARADCEHLERTPGPGWVWMPYPAVRWCVACWPTMVAFYLRAQGGPHCHRCNKPLRPRTTRLRSLRFYEESMTAALCARCARKWDSWGDGNAATPGAAWAAYRDQDWDTHDTAAKARFGPWHATD